MTAVLAAAIAFAPQTVKYVNLDDFTTGEFSVTLVGGQQDDREFAGLDRAHCAFGQRRTFLDISSNPNHATLVFAVGNHEQRFDSDKQVAWHYWLRYGDVESMDIDLSNIQRFYFDCEKYPDITEMYVRDKSGKDAGNGGWLLQPHGVYFNRSAFAGSVDWKHIVFLQYQQSFSSFPNPLFYTVTRFYATVTPGVSPPASRIG
ncbi:MAG: hypothetical protein JST30_17255 [Armatimonadetes bacterium]|nr:hypothetical protein [Armatimonadota bacterium]